MFQKRIFSKILDLTVLFGVFFTPLLFFIASHDQFELPKLTFLALLLIPALLMELLEGEKLRPTPLSVALLLLLAVETASSLPATSLSWRTSLLGDYENFSGLSTFLLYLLWFRVINRRLTQEKLEKLLILNSLTAVLSALYAIGQHFGFDFIEWNADSVVATREFASLGNPNFLSAYLALSLPLFLGVSLKRLKDSPPSSNPPGFVTGALGAGGFLFLILATPLGASLVHLAPSIFYQFVVRAIGLALFSAAALRIMLLPSLFAIFCNCALMVMGLLSTGSRGGFLAAILGGAFWLFLVLRNRNYSASLKGRFSKIPELSAILALAVVFWLFFFLGHGFFNRLWDSTVHMGQSLAVSRLHIWRPGVKMAEANPVLGVGLDTFKIAFPYYSGIEFNQIDGMFMSSRMAHNELLQMACTTGFLGLAAYLGVLGAFIYMGRKAYRGAAPQGRVILAAVFASALAYQAQNLFSFGVASINLPWFLLLAVVQWNYRALQPAGTTSPVSKVLALAEKPLFAVLLLVLLWFPLTRLGADMAFGLGDTASNALKNPRPETSPQVLLEYSNFEMDEMRRASRLCPLEVKYVLYQGLGFEQRAQLDPDHAKDWDVMALDCYVRALRMSPANAYYYNDEGRLCTALSRFDAAYADKAEEAYGQAVHWDPDSPLFLLNWSGALKKVGKNDESEAEMQKAFDLDPLFSAKILSQIAFEKYRSGDKPAAYGLLADALQHSPSSAEAFYCRGILYLQDGKKKLALKDFETVQGLNPTPEKNPSIQGLDQLIEETKK